MPLQLIVKGGKDVALAQAEQRGIRASFVTVNHGERHTETILSAPSEEWDAVSGWFQEDLGRAAPFPQGSLLHYGEQA